MCIAIRHISWHWWRVVIFCVATLLSATSHAQQPQIRNLDPGTLMARDGSQPLTLRGSNFRPGLTVTVVAENGRFRKTLAPSQVAVDSAGQITLQINTTAAPDDSWQVFVTNPDGTRSNIVGFRVVSVQPPQSQQQAQLEQQQRQPLLDGVAQLERGLQTLPPGESRERAQRELAAARNAIQAGRIDETRQRLSAVQQAMQTASAQQQRMEAESQRQAEQQRQSQLAQQRQSEADSQQRMQAEQQRQHQGQQRQAEIDRQRQVDAERQRQAQLEQQQRQSLLDGVAQLERGLQTLPPGESRERAQRELAAARSAIQAGRMDEARQRLSVVQQAMQTASGQQQQMEAEHQRQAEQQRQSQLEQQRQSEAERQRQMQAEQQRQHQGQQRQAEIDRQRQIEVERQRQAQAEQRYGEDIGEFEGIKAYSNADCTGTFKGKCSNWQENAKYQCVDYARRYYAKNTVVNSIWGSASTFWERSTFEGFQRYLNDGSSNQLPQRGDMLFFNTGQKEGHVAIVMEVNGSRVRVIQQNIKRNTAYANIAYQKDGNKVSLKEMSFDDGTTAKKMDVLGWLTPVSGLSPQRQGAAPSSQKKEITKQPKQAASAAIINSISRAGSAPTSEPPSYSTPAAPESGRRKKEPRF